MTVAAQQHHTLGRRTLDLLWNLHRHDAHAIEPMASGAQMPIGRLDVHDEPRQFGWDFHAASSLQQECMDFRALQVLHLPFLVV